MINNILFVLLGVWIGLSYTTYVYILAVSYRVIKGEFPPSITEGFDKLMKVDIERSTRSLKMMKWVLFFGSPLLVLYAIGLRIFKKHKDSKSKAKELEKDGYYHWNFESIWYIPKNFPYNLEYHEDSKAWTIETEVGDIVVEKAVRYGDEIVWNKEGKIYIY